VSRDDNDALEAAQARALSLAEKTARAAEVMAGLELQRDRLAARLWALKKKRDALRVKMDSRPGSGLLSAAGACAGAVLARGGWELRSALLPDERVALAVGLLATAVVLQVSRTHWFRFGFRR
jgi:hypothetical protein